MKYLALILASLLLFGCETTEEHAGKEKSFSEQAALKGCTIEYIGDYPRKSVSDIPIVLAKCEGKSTITSNSLVQRGRNTVPVATITISEIDSQIADLEAKRNALNKLTPEEKAILGLK